MQRPRHWQDPVSAVAGVVLLLSPWLAGYAMVQPALANAVIVGVLLYTVAVAASVLGRPWVECAIAALGAWMLVSPWVLSFADGAARAMALALGAVVLVLALAALLSEWRRAAR